MRVEIVASSPATSDPRERARKLERIPGLQRLGIREVDCRGANGLAEDSFEIDELPFGEVRRRLEEAFVYHAERDFEVRFPGAPEWNFRWWPL